MHIMENTPIINRFNTLLKLKYIQVLIVKLIVKQSANYNIT